MNSDQRPECSLSLFHIEDPMARIAKSIPFAATLLRQRSTWLIQQLALLKRHIGENSIHDTRVQSRRMRAALEAFQDLIPASEWQQFYDSVREITRALGEIRETEVMCSLIEGLATPEDLGEQVALEFLEEKLQRKMRKLRKRLDRELSRTDLRRLRAKPTSSGRSASCGIRRSQFSLTACGAISTAPPISASISSGLRRKSCDIPWKFSTRAGPAGSKLRSP
jgi:hypothetical protein